MLIIATTIEVLSVASFVLILHAKATHYLIAY